MSDGNACNIFTSNGYFQLDSQVDPVGFPSNGIAIGSPTVTDINPAAAVPEPTSMAILGFGLTALGISRRAKRSTTAT